MRSPYGYYDYHDPKLFHLFGYMYIHVHIGPSLENIKVREHAHHIPMVFLLIYQSIHVYITTVRIPVAIP